MKTNAHRDERHRAAPDAETLAAQRVSKADLPRPASEVFVQKSAETFVKLTWQNAEKIEQATSLDVDGGEHR